MNLAAEGRGSKFGDALYLVWFSVVLGVFFFTRSTHGFTYPTPWPDEGSFLWQAINFGERGTLFSPELNPERHVLWMPPGYMVVMGGIFAVFGFSLELARFVSAVFIALAMAGVAWVVRGSRLRFGHVLVMLVFLETPIFQLAANTARMEPLIVLLASLAFVLVARGAWIGGAAVAVLAPLVHPNGVFPAVAALAVLGSRTVAKRKLPDRARWEWVAVGLSVLLWALYAIYVAMHFEEFLVDIQNQLSWKEKESAMSGGVSERMTTLESVIPLVVWVAIAVATWRSGRRPIGGLGPRGTVALFALAGAFVIQTVVTVGWLYDLYAAFAYCALAILALEQVAAWVLPKLPSQVSWVVGAVMSVAVAALSFFAANRPFLLRSVTSTTVIRSPREPPYVVPEDRRIIARYLRSLERVAGPITVQFLPEADALLYADLRSKRISMLHPTRYEGKPDVYILHDSVWIPEFVRTMTNLRMAFQQEIPVPVSKWGVLRRRDGTEEWRVYRRR